MFNKNIIFGFSFWFQLMQRIDHKLPKFYVYFSYFLNVRLVCLALYFHKNGKHHTENHATKVMKKQKTKLLKYVMSRALETKKHVSHQSSGLQVVGAKLWGC